MKGFILLSWRVWSVPSGGAWLHCGTPNNSCYPLPSRPGRRPGRASACGASDSRWAVDREAARSPRPNAAVTPAPKTTTVWCRCVMEGSMKNFHGKRPDSRTNDKNANKKGMRKNNWLYKLEIQNIECSKKNPWREGIYLFWWMFQGSLFLRV